MADLQSVPAQSGLVLLPDVQPGVRRAVRRLARSRRLPLIEEHTDAPLRVHNLRELRRALNLQPPVVLISPIFSTPSHPGWPPLPRMRAAALARLAKGKALALGGMDSRRYAKIAPLGFIGWAGISAFRT